MGKAKKEPIVVSLEELQKDLPSVPKQDLQKVVGGNTDFNKHKIQNPCGGIPPQ